MARFLASAFLAVSAGSLPAAAQEVCLQFLEEHPYDEAWEKGCLDELETLASLPPPPAASSQGQQSLGLEAPMLFPERPRNMSVAACAGLGFPGTQNEVMIARDPTSDRAFAISNAAGAGLFSAFSSDRGCSWVPSQIADGQGDLPGGLFDPWAVFDDFGNLWISYVGEPRVAPDPPGVPIYIARSTDGGQTFLASEVWSIGDGSDQYSDKPVMATGPDTTTGPPGRPDAERSLWLIFVVTSLSGSRTIYAQGAALNGSGDLIMDFCETTPQSPADPFCPAQEVAVGDPGISLLPGDIDIGPDGQVLVSYSRTSSSIVVPRPAQPGPSPPRASARWTWQGTPGV